MKADSEHTDVNRLEELAREAYSVMATTMANYNCMESLVRLKRFIKAKRKVKQPFFSIGQNQMGYHVFPFLTDLMIRHCTTLVPTRLIFPRESGHPVKLG